MEPTDSAVYVCHGRQPGPQNTSGCGYKFLQEIYTHIDNDALRVAARANPLGRVKRQNAKKEDSE